MSFHVFVRLANLSEDCHSCRKKAPRSGRARAIPDFCSLNAKRLSCHTIDDASMTSAGGSSNDCSCPAEKSRRYQGGLTAHAERIIIPLALLLQLQRSGEHRKRRQQDVCFESAAWQKIYSNYVCAVRKIIMIFHNYYRYQILHYPFIGRDSGPGTAGFRRPWDWVNSSITLQIQLSSRFTQFPFLLLTQLP